MRAALKKISTGIDKALDIFYRFFAGIFFTVSGAAGVCALFIDRTAWEFPIPALIVAALGIGLSMLFPKIVGARIKRFFAYSWSKFHPYISRTLSWMKKTILGIPVPPSLRKLFSTINREGNELFLQSAWYIRYPLAVISSSIAITLALYALEAENGFLAWLGAALFGFYALAYGRELALLAIALVLIFWIFKGIAALPISVAVIIGALIIASAVRR